jgi:CheY-like chemotaxis protein
MGLTAIETENGRSALLWLADNPAPAIILLDLLMPEVDGFEFLDAFKRNGDWQDIPVIVMTGMQLTAEQRARLLRQVRNVVAKGSSINADISTAIAEAVRRRPADMTKQVAV